MDEKVLSKAELKNVLEKEISEAEMVLVGLGEEFDLCKDEKDLALVESVLAECDAAWLMPEVRNGLRKCNQMSDEGKHVALLKELADRLQGKNYYVLCMAGNRKIAEISWREGRLVAPCGFGTKKQCVLACEGEEPKELTEEETKEIVSATEKFLSDAEIYKNTDLRMGEENSVQGQWGDLPPQVREAMELIRRREKIRTAALKYKKKCEGILGTCPSCGAQEVLNDMLAPKYDQRGYLADWTKYTKWLYGSMNRKLLILGLGSSNQHPELLQGAFQKMAELHTKANYYQFKLFEE